MPPTVVALHLCPSSRGPLLPVPRAWALGDQGLQGDRHARAGSARQVLLVEEEVLDELGLKAGQVREQVTVRGLRLNDLEFGARLRIGDALFEVAGPCAPCERMNELRMGLKQTLEGRRGRFLRVVAPGAFSVGDTISLEPKF